MPSVSRCSEQPPKTFAGYENPALFGDKNRTIMDAFVIRLLHERKQLATRYYDLGEFLKTDKFVSLDNETKGLLVDQYEHMAGYLGTITARLNLILGPGVDLPLTPGQKAIRVSFNPSKFKNVDAIKDKAAELWDELSAQKAILTSGSNVADGEQIAQYILATRKVEEASMRGVGAATYGL